MTTEVSILEEASMRDTSVSRASYDPNQARPEDITMRESTATDARLLDLQNVEANEKATLGAVQEENQMLGPMNLDYFFDVVPDGEKREPKKPGIV